MAQFKVGDKVRMPTFGDGVVVTVKTDELEVKFCNGTYWVSSSSLQLLTSTLTITATLTSETIPTELIKQLSAAGFLITIQNQPK